MSIPTFKYFRLRFGKTMPLVSHLTFRGHNRKYKNNVRPCWRKIDSYAKFTLIGARPRPSSHRSIAQIRHRTPPRYQSSTPDYTLNALEARSVNQLMCQYDNYKTFHGSFDANQHVVGAYNPTACGTRNSINHRLGMNRCMYIYIYGNEGVLGI